MDTTFSISKKIDSIMNLEVLISTKNGKKHEKYEADASSRQWRHLTLIQAD